MVRCSNGKWISATSWPGRRSILNIEANHAALAGHTFAHDLRMATDAKLLGSIDANRGDPQNGWDTDQFPPIYMTAFTP